MELRLFWRTHPSVHAASVGYTNAFHAHGPLSTSHHRAGRHADSHCVNTGTATAPLDAIATWLRLTWTPVHAPPENRFLCRHRDFCLGRACTTTHRLAHSSHARRVLPSLGFSIALRQASTCHGIKSGFVLLSCQVLCTATRVRSCVYGPAHLLAEQEIDLLLKSHFSVSY